jgi:hypothetical protein
MVSGIAEIENVGTAPLYFSSGSIDFEDGTGKLLAAETFVSNVSVHRSTRRKGLYG